MILGDIMLVPLLYYGVTNSLSLPTVFLVGFFANTITDLLWYWIGSYFPKEKIYKTFHLDRLQNKNPEIFESFSRNGGRILFISKFIYGIRVPVRILYAIEKLSFKAYMKINIWGSIIWLILVSGLANSLNVGAEELKIYVWRGEVAMLGLMVIVFLFQFVAKRYAKKILKP